ncbi:MAG: prolyl oligopeptidase family serine peptidase [Kiritimatiellae bacterium]|nr:prolyl oligopeptidase family serine peptidase [Kiritimatiellia bacterium]
MNNEPLERFAYAAFPPAGAAPRGIVVHFMGLGSQWQAREGDGPHGLEREGAAAAASAGAVFVVPYLDPWNWMNAGACAETDRIVALAKAQAGLPADAPVVSTGGSMGGLCALVWPRYTRHRVVAVAANCPVCDLPFHYTERPDLPRTLRAAFAAEPDFDAALRARSPLHLTTELPDLPLAVFHCTEDALVAKAAHSDRLVAALRALGRAVEYVEVPGRGHCDLDEDAWRRYADFVRDGLSRSAPAPAP